MGGASPLPITQAERLAYADGHGIERASEEYEDFEHYLRALDRTWLEEHSRKAQKR